MSELQLRASDALAEMRELMLLAARDDCPQRLAATSYTNYRDILLRSELRPSLPGFLFQCVTIYRFKEFIQLFSPHVADRIAFIEQCLSGCEARIHTKRAFDVLAEHHV